MDPKTIDIVWEMHQELGSNEPVHVISGYRSPKTNAMLRRTRGGQAKKSQHMVGKAIDISFPDVPLRRMRYSAMIRERGGVGYYPTSGIPFVHVDSARVRHWPRMARNELALIFPSGKSQHKPKGGRPLSKADVVRARKNKTLATEVAQFFATRRKPGQTIVAHQVAPKQWTATVARVEDPPPAIPKPRTATGTRPTKTQASRPKQLASLTALPMPRLLTAPKPATRTPKVRTTVHEEDKDRLNQLVTLARLVQGPKPAPPPIKIAPRSKTAPTASSPIETAAIAKAATSHPFTNGTPADLGQLLRPSTPRLSWINAPDYDDDHPEEESYRRFAIAPLVTETPSVDDPTLTQLVHPNREKTFSLLSEEQAPPPLRFGAALHETLAKAQTFSQPTELPNEGKIRERRIRTTAAPLARSANKPSSD